MDTHLGFSCGHAFDHRCQRITLTRHADRVAPAPLPAQLFVWEADRDAAAREHAVTCGCAPRYWEVRLECPF